MNELGQRPKRAGAACAGFVVPFVLLLSVALAYRADYFADVGWRGGEYAYTFIGVASGAIVVGVLFKALQPKPPWSSFGSGMILAGTLGVVITIAITVLVMSALSRTSAMF